MELDVPVQVSYKDLEHIMMNYTKEQITDFNKEIDGLREEFKKKLQVCGEDLGKAVETITTSITKVDNHLTAKIDVVQAKVVVEAV